MALVFVMEKLGTLYEILLTIGSILDAPIFAIFVMGMLIPHVGKKGALVGGYASLLFTIWLVIGSQWHVINKRIHFKHLPTSIEGCDFTSNQTTLATTMRPPISPDDEPFFLFRISMFHFTFVGSLVGILTGLFISFITKEMDAASVNPDYISPVLHRYV